MTQLTRRQSLLGLGLLAAGMGAAYTARDAGKPLSNASAMPERFAVGAETHDVYRLKRGIAYNAMGQTLDLYWPNRVKPGTPVLVMVHGGGWYQRNPENMEPSARLFAEKGYLVANITYRLSDRHPFPAAVEDVADAVGWVKANMPASHRDRISLVGYSAGGNLALLTGVGKARSDIESIVAIAAPSDLSRPYGQNAAHNRRNIRLFQGRASLSDISPIEVLERNVPPILLIQGDKDTSVKLEQAVLFHNRARMINAPVRLMVAQGKDHFWLLNPKPEKNRLIYEALERFITAPVT